jgi:hypothetical protein
MVSTDMYKQCKPDEINSMKASSIILNIINLLFELPEDMVRKFNSSIVVKENIWNG